MSHVLLRRHMSFMGDGRLRSIIVHLDNYLLCLRTAIEKIQGSPATKRLIRLGSVAHTSQFPVVMLYEEAAELVEVRFNPDDPVETPALSVSNRAFRVRSD